MKGKIIVNPFGIPGQSVKQAKRLKEEFLLKGVQAEILSDAFLRLNLSENQIKNQLGDTDFVIFLDKDKYLSEMIMRLGIRMFNSHESIRVCDDKGQTYLALANKGFNIPKTQFAPVCYSSECQISDEYINHLETFIGYPIIVKPSFGSCGNGIYKAQNREELVSAMQKLKLSPHLFQEYLGAEVGKDKRIIVIGGKAVAGMERYNSNDFRSNIAQGGKGIKLDLTLKEYQSVVNTAQGVAKELELDYCGVDIIKGNNGEDVICEVNSNAFFEGIEVVTKINVASIYADYVIKEILKKV